MNLALSTSWNAARFSEGAGIVREISAAGFSEIELSFNLTSKIANDILSLSRKKKIKVVSLHNYCPIPEGLSREAALPDVYSLSSLNENERKNAVYFTKKSIDYSAKLKARALVLHCGYVVMQENTRLLIELYSSGRKESREFLSIKNRMREVRDSKITLHLTQVIKSLEELNGYAGKSGLSLGIENRFYAREIPNYEEIGLILAHFNKGNIFYWHDTGHAQVMENLGFVNSSVDFLTQYGLRLIGMHLHDIKACRDHLAPLSGDFDFNKIKPYITASTIKVIEAHSPATLNDIVRAKLHLEKILG